jgi:hypothetical protein
VYAHGENIPYIKKERCSNGERNIRPIEQLGEQVSTAASESSLIYNPVLCSHKSMLGPIAGVLFISHAAFCRLTIALVALYYIAISSFSVHRNYKIPSGMSLFVPPSSKKEIMDMPFHVRKRPAWVLHLSK